jgi:hypothetical protein
MKRKTNKFCDMVVKYVRRQRKRDRDGDLLTKRDEYWLLRGVYKSHMFMRESVVVRTVHFDMNDRMRLIDQKLIDLANELNIPNRYRDWKLD